MTDLDSWFEPVAENDLRIRGTRVNIVTVIQQWKGGASAEEIAEELPSLSLEAVYASILYYLTHRDELDARAGKVVTFAETDSPVLRRMREAARARRGPSEAAA